MNKRFHFLSIIFPTVALLALTACGGTSGDGQIPVNASLSVNPSAITWNVNTVTNSEGDCLYNPDLYIDEIINVVALDGEQRALGDVEVLFSLALAGNTFSGPAVVELYNDRNGNFIPEANEFVSSENDDLFSTQTDQFNGSISLILRMNISCTYLSRLTATIPGASAVTTIEVTEESSTVVEPELETTVENDE